MLNRQNPTGADTGSLENLEARRLMTSAHAIGINVNDSSAAMVSKSTPIMKDLGVKTVRLWSTVNDFNNKTIPAAMNRAIDYSNAGFEVLMVVHTGDGKVPNAAAVKSWFAWAVQQPGLASAIDHWEIGNEVDSPNYWDGNLKQYVDSFLKPAYESLHAKGEEVISAGPSWNPQDIQTMIDYGMLNYVDYVGAHPYANGVAMVKQRIQEINAVVAGRKPIAATEWNVRGYENNKTKWANAITEAYPYIKAGFDLNYYFCLEVQNTPAGPGGILTTGGALNQPFYNAFATFKGVGGGTGTGGNTPSGATGTITGTLFNDTDKDGTFDSSEVNTGSRVVYIDKDGDGKLDAGEKTATSDAKGVYKFTGLAKGSYKVSRVFPEGFKLSNNSLGYVTATVTAGKTTGGVNIGTMSITSAPLAGTGSITGTLFEDADKDGTFDAAEARTGSRVVFLDADGDAKLDAGEKSTTSDAKGVYKFSNLAAGTYKVTRVFPANFKLSNNSLGYVTAAVAAGKTTAGVNIGTTSGTVATTAPAVTQIRLIDTNTNKVIAAYSNITKSTTIKLSGLPTQNIAIEAVGNGQVHSMKLTALGKTITESNAPYAFFTDNYGDFAAWSAKKGSYTVSATAYSGENATGTKGNTLSVTLTFV